MTENQGEPMTDPTPEPTPEFSPARLEEMADLALSAHAAYMNRGVLAQMLRFAARRARQTCDSCRFAGKLLFDPAVFVYMTDDSNGRECHLTQQLPGGSIRMENMVPLTVHGQPFKCEAWEAKETK